MRKAIYQRFCGHRNVNSPDVMKLQQQLPAAEVKPDYPSCVSCAIRDVLRIDYGQIKDAIYFVKQ